jgi:2-polyprenyl-3-methyl-5-hydroxy-6-metoxy-1,4-benzoquinol methylase
MIDNGGIACEPAEVCAVCGGPGLLLHEGLTDHLFGAPGRWSIRQCRSDRCGLGWVDPKPVVSDIGKLYETYYTHAGTASEREASGSAQIPPRSALKRLLGILLPWQSAQFASGLLHLEDLPPGRLLEMGCGSGNFLAAAAAHGWAAEGMDFDEKAIAAANVLTGVTARVGDLDDPALVDGRYDAIVMNHVIEHLPDPVHAFARCAALLRPGGRLVMVTPNMAAQGRDIFGPDWRGLEIPRHLHLFTAASLRRLAGEAGFSSIQCFSSIGGHETAFMVELSSEIARKAGRTPPQAKVRQMRIRAALASLLGGVRGEFVVLVAER